ncbi:MalY/PatB family protein [Polycladidibacter hongkongensis]|uniref:MalY/PatB family protein n=1 Tax=Polycladidibacter hongkongensis TaxID=1647556 RepID=UPI000837055C|nr:MalY/PatB family protein [Pseudovibrio hongkongensis]
MTIDFDREVSRINTHSLKWDELGSRYQLDPAEALPMWVADMDFRPPEAVAELLQDAAEHGINGYYGDNETYLTAVQSWMARRHDFPIEKDWIVWVPGIVAGYSMAIQAFSQPGDGVLVFSPVYHAFARAVHANGRKLVESELINDNGSYRMDFERLPELVDQRTKILLLCSPHNPGGRVWREDELRQLCEFCIERGILIISDEIHQDLVFEGHKHIVTQTLSPEIAKNTITFVAASKTFNLAGFMSGSAIISDDGLRRRYNAQLHACGIGATRLGPLSTAAAYDHGEVWLEKLLPYLKENERLLTEGVEAAIAGAKVMQMEATYLSWVDMSGVDLEISEITRRVERVAKIATNHGGAFGKGGEQYLRFNIACPRSTVIEAVHRLEQAFADLRKQSR